jgi:peptidoglycan/LPS O-acetylase OafA/YrhL
MMQAPQPKQTFLGVQALRGVAAALVVVHHCTQLWDVRLHPQSTASGWGNGAAGVDIFFVISGFVMAFTALGRRRMTGMDFLRRRIVRIVPLYWICTLATIAALVMRYRHNLSSSGEFHATHILASFLFLPTVNKIGNVAPVLVIGWTLSYEMFFYLLFAASLAFSAKVSPLRLLTGLMIVISCIGLFHRGSWPVITVLSQPIILEFVAGLWLAYAVLQRQHWPDALMMTLGLLGLLVLLLLPLANDAVRPFYWGIPAFAIVSSAVMGEDRIVPYLPQWVLRIGDASYSLYLSHLFVLNALASAASHIHVLLRSEAAFVLTGLMASTLFALLLYRLVEAPITLAIARRTHLRPPAIILNSESS